VGIGIGGHHFAKVISIFLCITLKGIIQWCVSSRNAVVGCSLKYRQMLGLLSNHRNGLNAG
jgi:hypothetical protein